MVSHGPWKKPRRLDCPELLESRLPLASDVVGPFQPAEMHDNPDPPLPGMMAISSERGTDFELMQSMGVKLVRMYVQWNSHEKEDGTRDFSRLKVAFQTFVDQGIQPIVALRSISPWRTVCGLDVRPDCPPEDYGQWRDFVRDLATELEFANPIFEIGNEPNAFGFWDTGGEKSETSFLDDYLLFLKESHTAIKSVSPELRVMSAGMADNIGESSFTEVFWRRHDLFYEKVLNTEHFDLLAIHNYYLPEIESNGHTFRSYIERIESLMRSAGKIDVPVIITEMGFSARPTERFPDSDEQLQARRFELAYQDLTDPQLEIDIDGFIWLRALDSMFPQNFREYAFMGLFDRVDGDFVPRSAQAAFSFAATTGKLDLEPPTSSVEALPLEVESAFGVRWSGDDAGGTGVASFDVYVSTDGGPFSTWLENTQATDAIFEGTLGSTYEFYSVATDHAGRTQESPQEHVTDARVTAMPGDLDEDGIVGFSDFLILSSHFGQTGVTRESGDYSGDGSVDFADFLFLTSRFGFV